MQVALVQHRLVFAIRSRPDSRPAATVTKTGCGGGGQLTSGFGCVGARSALLTSLAWRTVALEPR
jgi:hypothetical protein